MTLRVSIRAVLDQSWFYHDICLVLVIHAIILLTCEYLLQCGIKADRVNRRLKIAALALKRWRGLLFRKSKLGLDTCSAPFKASLDICRNFLSAHSG